MSSFQTQYGLRLARELNTMSWTEFSQLLSGLNGDTPLGHIVSIRAETDPDTLKQFTPEQHRIRSSWLKKQAQSMSEDAYKRAIEDLKQAFISMAGGKHEEKG